LIVAGQSLIQTMRRGEMQYLPHTYLNPKIVFCEMILKLSEYSKKRVIQKCVTVVGFRGSKNKWILDKRD